MTVRRSNRFNAVDLPGLFGDIPQPFDRADLQLQFGLTARYRSLFAPFDAQPVLLPSWA
jgi:hypothetical protein